MLQPQTVADAAPKLAGFGDTAPVAPASVTQTEAWQIIRRERDQQVWSAPIVRRDPISGREVRRTLEFVEVGTGMNFRDANGEYQPTREEFLRTADGGFIAEFGPHRLALGNNINSLTAVDFTAGVGVRLRNGPLAVGFYDPVDGRNVILGTIRDTAPELTGPAEVTYHSAFDGIDASVRISYRRAGISADLILNEMPPDPATLGLSDLARLETYTEFDPGTPLPQQTARVLREESDPVLRQQIVEPDFTDHILDFGEYRMPTGTAFELKDAANSSRIPVAKRFTVITGRPVLIEAVEWQAAKSLMASLPPARKGGDAPQQAATQVQRRAGFQPALAAQRPNGVRPSSGVEPAELQTAQNRFNAKPETDFTEGNKGNEGAKRPVRLRKQTSAAAAPKQPPPLPSLASVRSTAVRRLPSRVAGKAPPVQEARANRPDFDRSRAFVLDYSLVTGATNMTFASDKTFFVSSDVHLYGHTVFENAVIKLTNWPASAALRIKGTVEFKTGEYTPLIFTSQSDNSAGESLPFGSGNPWTNYCAGPAIEIDSYTSGQPASIKHVRVSHAYTAFSFFTGTGHELKHAQIVHSSAAFTPYYADVRLRNVLVYLADRVVAGSGAASATMRFEHLTAHQANHLNWDSGFGPSSTTYLTNSLFVAVTNVGTYSGANNASNTSSSVFSVVGAGAHYLADATFRGLGTTNLNTNLLAEIRKRTTQPPLTVTNGFLAADTTLNPRSALRYTNNAFPDLGFHYPILDHVLGLVTMTNVQLTINPGAAVGLTIAEPGNYALLLADGAKLLVEGSPTNLARLIRAHLVQEQANDAWKNHGFSLVLPWWTANPVATVSLRFAQVATVYDEILIGYNQPANITFRDSQLHGGTLYNLSGSSIGITNCLWDRVYLSADLSTTPGVALRNNLFRGGTFEMFPAADTTVRDNLFDQTVIPYLDNVTSSHNGYLLGYDRLLPTNSTDKVLTSLTYDTGALSKYYLPAGSALIDAGSQSAASAGLVHFTTLASQTKDSGSVDIGLHLMALNGSGQPVDTDSDYVSDWQEDVDGDGVQDTGEFSHTAADTDNDADGLTNYQESLLGYSAVKTDSDGNGVLDPHEDYDGDLLSNIAEFGAGYNSDPKILNSKLATVSDAVFFHGAPQGEDDNPTYILTQSGVSPTFPPPDNIRWVLADAPENTVWRIYYFTIVGSSGYWSTFALGDAPTTTFFQNVNPNPVSGLFGAGIASTDSDVGGGDGLDDGWEIHITRTSPNSTDTDGDRYSDGPLTPGTPPSGGTWLGPNDAFPRDRAAWRDTDGDGMPDDLAPGIATTLVLDLDDDNDGIPDLVEAPAGTPFLSDPKDPNSLPPPTYYVDARYVPPGGQRDGSKSLPFAAIRDAIDALPFGIPDRYDVIQIERGVYCGPRNHNIIIDERNVILIAPRGPEETFIDGGAVADCDILANTACDPALPAADGFILIPIYGTARISGFTIRNMPGSGVVCAGNASPVIMNCVLTNNGTAGGNGGGFWLHNTSPVILNCRVVNNGTAASLGGGLYAESGGQPQISHCTFSGNARPANQGQIHARTGAILKLNNSTVWSAFTDPEIVAVFPGTVAASYCNVRGAAPSGVLNRSVNPLLEASGRLTRGAVATPSGSLERGTTNSVPGYNWVTRFDADGEARLQDLQIQPANLLFSADIGSDEYVYRLQFPIVTDSDGTGRPKLLQSGQLVECDIPASQVDEASGVAFLGNDGTGRAILAILDDEQEEQFFIYTLNAEGTGIAVQTPITTLNLTGTYSGNDRQVLDLEGVTYDDANRNLYLICSNTKARRYRGVENTLLDPMVFSPTNDYSRRRNILMRVGLNADLTTVSATTHFEPEEMGFPAEVYTNPTRGLIATMRANLNVAPYTAQTWGTHVLIAWNTVDKFGAPVNGTSYSAGAALPGGGTVLNVYAAATTAATHGSRLADTWYYYKMWIRNGATVATYTYREFMTASAQTRNYHTLLINEFVAESTAGGQVNDWIELFNPMNVAAALNTYRIRCSPPGEPNFMIVGEESLFPASAPSVSANLFRQLLANNTEPPVGANLTFQLSKNGEQIILRPPTPAMGPDTITIDHWVFGDGQRDDQSEGRAWDGGPSGMRSKPLPHQRVRDAAKYQAAGAALLPTTPGNTASAANHGVQRNSFIAAARNDNDTIYLSWRWRTQSPASWDYSPKLHDGHALNVESIAYRPAGGGLANPEMIVGLRSPLSIDRVTGNALYFRVDNVANFLPAGGWAAAAAGVVGPQTLNLNGQGIRSIEWCPSIGPAGAGRYLIIGGPANGGPLEKETFGEKFSLYSWDGGVNTTPTRLINDLRPYTVRPEGVDIITVGGQSRVLFVEDRFLAQGYGTRNAIHWPISILSTEVAIP